MPLIRFICYFIFPVLAVSCTRESANDISDYRLQSIYGDEKWEDFIEKDLKVIYFLAPECPLCQNYALAMRELALKYPDVNFAGIFPGKEYNQTEIRQYLIRYDLNFNSYSDPDFKLVNTFGATITPEAFLLDSANQVIYSGAIDNWAISLGQKRLVVTKKYLEDAILALKDQRKIDPSKSKAIGCFIQ